MKKFKKLLASTLAMTTILSLVGCSSDTTTTTNEGGTTAETEVEKAKVTLIIPGMLGDKSYFDSANAGVEAAKAKYGENIEVSVQELGLNASDYEPGLLDAIDDGSDLVIAVGWQLQGPVETVASENPDTKFLIIDTPLQFDKYDLGNSNAAIFNAAECSYLAGAYAALVSETGTIGFLGGMDDVSIHEFAVGYIEGAKAINPDVKVLTSWVGSYYDAATAKTMATAQYDQGADIGFNVAGASGLGQIQAAAEKGKWAIGVDADQYEIFKVDQPELADHIPTSMVKAIDVAVLGAIDDYFEGTFQGGVATTLSLGEGATYLVKNDLYKSLLTEDELAKMEELEAKIIAGEIKVSNSFEMTPEAIQETINSVK